jgi:hypothetical protein
MSAIRMMRIDQWGKLNASHLNDESHLNQNQETQKGFW